MNKAEDKAVPFLGGSFGTAFCLAPLLPSRFNAARGATKWMDYARMGAVGIYTDVQPYSDHVLHAKDGLLLPNNPADWVKSILELADNPAQRAEMRLAVQDKSQAL